MSIAAWILRWWPRRRPRLYHEQRSLTSPALLTNDEHQVLTLARRLGPVEAIEVLAAALIETLAGKPGTTDADIAALRAIEEEAFKRCREARRAAE